MIQTNLLICRNTVEVRHCMRRKVGEIEAARIPYDVEGHSISARDFEGSSVRFVFVTPDEAGKIQGLQLDNAEYTDWAEGHENFMDCYKLVRTRLPDGEDLKRTSKSAF